MRGLQYTFHSQADMKDFVKTIKFVLPTQIGDATCVQLDYSQRRR